MPIIAHKVEVPEATHSGLVSAPIGLPFIYTNSGLVQFSITKNTITITTVDFVRRLQIERRRITMSV